MFAVALGSWLNNETITGYRYVPKYSVYPPAEAYPGDGRFDDGARHTLYLASSPVAAAAEFYRREPDFLAIQGTIAEVSVFEVVVVEVTMVLDLRDPAQAVAVGIDFERLRSSDADEVARYRECRDLAQEVDAVGSGIAYPSAALTDVAWCLVLFGPEGPGRWRKISVDQVAVPHVPPNDVVVLPAA